LSYSWYEQLKYALEQKGWAPGEEIFAENVQLEVCVPAAGNQQFEAWIDEFAKRQVRWKRYAR
jgi:putative IMPACT (imprinted ancient) family translation regulator